MNVLDLFSGIGGFSLGLERAGMRTVAFCEIEPFCRAVLRKHWPRVEQFADVRELDAGMLDLFVGERIDVICGGFPCQDISLAGKGAGLSGERSGLWREYHRLIAEIRPRYAIIENVSALRSRGLDQVLGSLAAIGYDAEWHCIPVAAVGAPHRRDRIWIIAYPQQQQQLRQQSGWRSGSSGAGAPQSTEHGEVGDVADADIDARRQGRPSNAAQERGRRDADRSGIGADGMGDTNVARLEERGSIGSHIAAELASALGADWWLVEPDVGRVAHGVPARVDRLRALGNAVVPQIPEIIGRAIMKAEGLA